jgi:hypothetical protein
VCAAGGGGGGWLGGRGAGFGILLQTTGRMPWYPRPGWLGARLAAGPHRQPAIAAGARRTRSGHEARGLFSVGVGSGGLDRVGGQSESVAQQEQGGGVGEWGELGQQCPDGGVVSGANGCDEAIDECAYGFLDGVAVDEWCGWLSAPALAYPLRARLASPVPVAFRGSARPAGPGRGIGVRAWGRRSGPSRGRAVAGEVGWSATS